MPEKPPAYAVTRVGPLSSRVAYALLALLFIVGWGAGFVNAVLSLVDDEQPGKATASWATATTAQVLSVDLGVLALVTGLAWLRGVTVADLGMAPAQDRATRLRDLDIGLAYLASLLASGVAMNLLGGDGFPFTDGAWAALPLLVTAVGAGPTEELALLALPVLLLRQAHQPLWRISLVLVLLRLSFHVYYGPAVVGLALWAGVVFVLFWRTGRALPLVVAHSAWDIGVMGSHYAGTPGEATFGLVSLSLLLVGVVRAILGAARRCRRLRAPAGIISAPTQRSTMQNR